jgi:hypothetical protein
VVDTTPPTLELTAGPAALTNDSRPTFAFGADDAGASFGCSLDGGAFAPCTSPHAVGPLADGVHTLQLRATDASDRVADDPRRRDRPGRRRGRADAALRPQGRGAADGDVPRGGGERALPRHDRPEEREEARRSAPNAES